MTQVSESSIPIEKHKFISVLASKLPSHKQEKFLYFARLLETYCNDKFEKILGQLKTHYHPFDPDTETPLSLDETEERFYARDLVEKFSRFLEQQRFQKINNQDILDMLEQYELPGLEIKVPKNQYRDMVVYYREKGVRTRYYRKWYTLWLKRYFYHTPYYRRLAFLFYPFRIHSLSGYEKLETGEKTRNFILPQEISLKLFKELSQDYLAVLFPGISVSMTKVLQVYVTFLILISLGTIGGSIFMLSKPWYCLTALAPIFLISREIIVYRGRKEKYYRQLLTNFYHNSLNNNAGVLSYMVEGSKEETYKQLLLVLHAFWSQESWGFHPVNKEILENHLKKFLLEHFGTKTKIDLENILLQLCVVLGPERSHFPRLVESISADKSYLRKNVAMEDRFLDVETREEPLPRSGRVILSSGTNHSESNSFIRRDFRLHIQNAQGVEYSHHSGSSLRWNPEKPYRTRLAISCPEGSSHLKIFAGDIDHIPLQGIGKVGSNGSEWEFRYYRSKDDNYLQLTTGLRYRHTPTEEASVMVRLLLPSFSSPEALPKESSVIPVLKDIFFPEKGFLVLGKDVKKTSKAYTLIEKEDDTFLQLQSPLSEEYPQGTLVSLTRPHTNIVSKVYAGERLIPVNDNSHFNLRGMAIIAPLSDREERLPYQKDVVKLELESTLQLTHLKGSTVYIRETGDHIRLLEDAYFGSKYLLVHGIKRKISEGNIILNPAERDEETFKFRINSQYIYLLEPLRYTHAGKTDIEENLFESSLKYEAAQGARFLTVEDASTFPLGGRIEVYLNGAGGVKEKFPFRRTECSNTLMLTTQTRKSFSANSPVLITAVETTTNEAIHFHDKAIDVDFSFIPNFPESGKITLESGSQTEEVLEFHRYPNRLYLNEPLKANYSLGTTVDFEIAPEFSLLESLTPNSTKVLLRDAHLLPSKGHIQIGEEVVRYQKFPQRVLLLERSRFHHMRGNPILLSDISDSVRLKTNVEKGSQSMRLENADELPSKGKIEIQGLFRKLQCEFIRESDVLYLKDPLRYGFSTNAKLKLPDLFLQSHLAPEMDYMEISDISGLPKNGNFHLPIKGLFSLRKKHKKSERLAFRFCREILWLDTPINQEYSEGTAVKSQDPLAEGTGLLEARTLEEATKTMRDLLEPMILE